ncbi:unnamed protein product [Durusdinium trenchii]|uniref:Uncharacterized protein n=1 Tax=Durusdinium trenchii TaxID=1381693 RepID=A0ABP0SWK5_9DINO
MSRLLGSCRKALKQLVEGEIPHVQPLLQNCFLQFLQIQDSAAFRRAKLIQRVMRMRASTEKQQILHVLSDWSQRALLTRQRKSFLSNEFDLVKEEVQQSWPKAAVGRIWNRLVPNILRYVSQLKELTAKVEKDDASDASTSAESRGEESTKAGDALPVPVTPVPVAPVDSRRRWVDVSTDSEGVVAVDAAVDARRSTAVGVVFPSTACPSHTPCPFFGPTGRRNAEGSAASVSTRRDRRRAEIGRSPLR